MASLELLNGGLTSHELLHPHADDRDLGQAAVLELLKLELGELLGAVLEGVEAIAEAEVAGGL